MISTHPSPETDPQKSGPDHIDRMVYSATMQVRAQYVQSCRNLGIQPRTLTPPVIGMRSVQ